MASSEIIWEKRRFTESEPQSSAASRSFPSAIRLDNGAPSNRPENGAPRRNLRAPPGCSRYFQCCLKYDVGSTKTSLRKRMWFLALLLADTAHLSHAHAVITKSLPSVANVTSPRHTEDAKHTVSRLGPSSYLQPVQVHEIPTSTQSHRN